MPTPDKADLIEQMLSEHRLRQQPGRVVKQLAYWLRDSCRSGLLFGRYDEPLNAYGQRLVRVILVELEATDAPAERLGSAETPQEAEIVRLRSALTEIERWRIELADSPRSFNSFVERIVANALAPVPGGTPTP